MDYLIETFLKQFYYREGTLSTVDYFEACRGTVVHPRGFDSVIRRMKSLVCSGIDSVCVFSTFALELEDK